MRRRLLSFLLLVFLMISNLSAQVDNSKLSFFEPADTFHQGRFWTSLSIGTAAYGAMVYGLSTAWYAESEQSAFHLFNDWGEWQHVDKAGHAMTAYNYTSIGFSGARWIGMNRKKALWTAAAVSFGMQGTIEVLDGFADKWGFSLPDIGFNTLGIGVFVAQELAWQEQRIVMKVSNTFPEYPNNVVTSADGLHTTTLNQRARDLYGTTFFDRFFKDYNGQVNWLSFNIHSFTKKKNNKIPKWLNIAVGYGAGNLYEGFDYSWTEVDTGIYFERDPNEFTRHSRIFLSFDIDTARLPIKNRFLKTLLKGLNFIKIPSPSLEFTTLGDVKFHAFYF